jgi:hypothetical protein
LMFSCSQPAELPVGIVLEHLGINELEFFRNAGIFLLASQVIVNSQQCS